MKRNIELQGAPQQQKRKMDDQNYSQIESVKNSLSSLTQEECTALFSQYIQKILLQNAMLKQENQLLKNIVTTTWDLAIAQDVTHNQDATNESQIMGQQHDI